MHVILVLLLLCENALASTIQFNIVRGKCDGTGLFSSCDDSAKGGICAYAADANRSWCCPPGEPLCGSWGQTCSGSGNLAGTGQLFCQSGNTRWCCNAQYEICIRDTNAINLCRTKFDNPYSNISEASALSLQSAFFATSTTSSKTTSSPISQKTTSSATTTLSQTTTLPQTTAEAAITPASSSSLSGGAIAGIVIGAIAGVALIAAGAFFLGRKYMRKGQNSIQTTPKYVVDMQDENSQENAFGRSELHNTSTPYDPYHGLEHSRSELP